jgi:hypothetical protein
MMSTQFQPPVEKKVERELEPTEARRKQLEEDANRIAEKSSNREKESQKQNNVFSR